MPLFCSSCSGLVLDLSSHKNEYASKYLASKGYYVLVEKRAVPAPNESRLSQEIQYVPLLLRPNETFHGYEARVAQRRPGGQEQSGASRNTASRGKRGKLRSRKSIVETTWPVKQSRLWRTFRIVFDYLPWWVLFKTVLRDFLILIYMTYSCNRKVDNRHAVTSRYCFPHFPKGIAPDWKNEKKCGTFSVGKLFFCGRD